jgi:hypothetical protein
VVRERSWRNSGRAEERGPAEKGKKNVPGGQGRRNHDPEMLVDIPLAHLEGIVLEG